MSTATTQFKAAGSADDSSAVPLGYKRTEVGMIPDNWEVFSIGELFDFLRTASNSRDDLSDTGAIAYVHYGDIHTRFHHFIDFSGDDVPHLLLGKGVTATRLRDGDLIVADASEDEVGVGKSVEVRRLGAIEAVAGLHTLLLRSKNRRIPNGYRAYLLEKPPVKIQLRRVATGLKVFGISKRSLRDVRIPLPPPPEQRAIAEALSDADGLLGALEALIAKKRAIKQAAMQQLLTGKTRLPGFSGEWETKRLGRFVTFLRHGVHSRAELTSAGAVRYLHYGDIHTSTDVRLDPAVTLMPRLAADRARNLDRLEDGDLVLVDASEDTKGVGKSVEITGVTGVEVVAGLHTIAARFDKAALADGFKAYLQFCPSFRTHLKRLAAGTKVYATNRAHIASVEMQLPGTDEQTAIATILSDMDAEITALERRRDKTRAIKQGMMQQLLTGRVRLVNQQSSANA